MKKQRNYHSNSINYYKDGRGLATTFWTPKGVIQFDCGVLPSKIPQLPKVLCVTHDHKDHSRYLNYYKKANIPIITWEDLPDGKLYTTLDYLPFTITLCRGVHDIPVVYFHVTYYDYPGSPTRLMYVTDTAKVIPVGLCLDYLIIGVVYSEWALDDSRFNHPKHFQHIINGHLSVEKAVQLIRYYSNLKWAYIIHTGGMDTSKIREYLEDNNIYNFSIYE